MLMTRPTRSSRGRPQPKRRFLGRSLGNFKEYGLLAIAGKLILEHIICFSFIPFPAFIRNQRYVQIYSGVNVMAFIQSQTPENNRIHSKKRSASTFSPPRPCSNSKKHISHTSPTLIACVIGHSFVSGLKHHLQNRYSHTISPAQIAHELRVSNYVSELHLFGKQGGGSLRENLFSPRFPASKNYSPA